MKLTREQVLRGAFHIAILGLIGYLVLGFIPSSTATVAVDEQTYRITGPYIHENLAIYLIHSDRQDERTYITLDEGLKSGVVKVTEKKTAQVNELTIENTGDDHLFLQEGDRVKGGQQDRTIYTSLVVPPHSGPMPLPAFCVEPRRWVAGEQGMKFGSTANPAVCPKEVRLAAKVQKDQGQVWQAVAQQKQVCLDNGLAGNTNSSLNESLDAPKVKRIAEEFARALDGVIADHPDAVGVAIAINGKMEEVNFYPNRAVLGKQFPRLVKSYSLTATLKQKDAAKAPTLSALDVGRFVWTSEQQAKKAEAAANELAALPRRTNGNNAPAANRPQQMATQQVTSQFQQVVGSQFVPQQQAVDQVLVQNNIAANVNPSNDAGQQILRNINICSQVQVQRASEVRATAPNVRRIEVVNTDNRMEVVEQAAVVNCKTEYHGKLVHRQYLAK